MIIISLPADLDLSEIYNHTLRIWDARQAEDYLQFLKGHFQSLDNDPALGFIVTNHPGIRCYVAKFNRRRSTYGHRIFYRVTEDGIEIARVLHTSMDWVRAIL